MPTARSVERLDALVSGPVDFIKIDVEGNGDAVLAGASGASSQRSIRSFTWKSVDESVGEFMAWVDRHGLPESKVFFLTRPIAITSGAETEKTGSAGMNVRNIGRWRRCFVCEPVATLSGASAQTARPAGERRPFFADAVAAKTLPPVAESASPSIRPLLSYDGTDKKPAATAARCASWRQRQRTRAS